MTGDDTGQRIRTAGPKALAEALRASRQGTLAAFACFEAAGLAGPAMPKRATLNPPLWELGHIGWFQAYWVVRNPERQRGHRADPDTARRPGPRPDADTLYDSSRVPHATRWALPLPDADATRAELAAQFDDTLVCLEAVAEDTAAEPPENDDALYFFRLVLLHEDMHHEASLYMAQALGVACASPHQRASPRPKPAAELSFEPGPWQLGHAGPGFAFDNELGAHGVPLPATRIDAQVVRWAEFLPFVEAGGYNQATQARCWSEAGQAWLAHHGLPHPLYWRRDGAHWQVSRHGVWETLDATLPACHLSVFEAEAWCAWAGRRLPSEAEWERAAVTRPRDFRWGDVWEWTASPFGPYPGFVAHPYRDYSAPWFGSRRVLRGASFAASARIAHPRYRNFFTPERNDIFAGFRSCAL
jgi:gamma-glutamyl hercynylcysteine S-oxide synthase